MADLNINFNFLGPLPSDITNELHLNKVPEYKVQNALSEQENKRVRLAQQHLQLIKEEEAAAQQIQEKKRKRQLLLQHQQEEKHQHELNLQRKLQQHKPKPNHIKEDDGPEL